MELPPCYFLPLVANGDNCQELETKAFDFVRPATDLVFTALWGRFRRHILRLPLLKLQISVLAVEHDSMMTRLS